MKKQVESVLSTLDSNAKQINVLQENQKADRDFIRTRTDQHAELLEKLDKAAAKIPTLEQRATGIENAMSHFQTQVRRRGEGAQP